MTEFAGTIINAAQPAPVPAMTGRGGASGTSSSNLDVLLSPARVFSHPAEVVGYPGLTCDEKRAILASWASDACAVEAAPALRRLPGAHEPVSIDAVLAALRALDPEQLNEAEPQLRQGSRVLWRNDTIAFRPNWSGRRTGIHRQRLRRW